MLRLGVNLSFKSMRGRHLDLQVFNPYLMVTLQWDHNFCCIIVDFEPLGTNEKHFVNKFFDQRPGSGRNNSISCLDF